MQNLLRFCSIISLILFTLKLGIAGNLTQGTVLFILIVGLLIVLGNRTIYIISSTIAALYIFIHLYGGNNVEQYALLQSILTLALVSFGLYIMIKGVFQTSGNRRRY